MNEPQAAAPAAVPVRTRPCWRCGGIVEATTAACPRCAAPLRRSSDRSLERRRTRSDEPLGRVLILFAVQLLTSIVFGIMVSFGMESDAAAAADPGRALRTMVGLELVDTVLIVGALLFLPQPRTFEPTMKPGTAWALAFPIMAGALALNQGYHAFVRSMLGARSEPDLLLAGGVTPLVFFAYCVQPAVIEELFFRRMALDSLRTVMTPATAALLSSLMFGLAHVGVPISIPVLALVGLALAWARIASGSLVLPMILHGLHNLVVILS